MQSLRSQNDRLQEWNDGEVQINFGAVQEGGFGRGMIYRRVAALVIAPAYVATTRHFLAAVHFLGGHGGIGQTGKERSRKPEEGQKRGDDAAASHRKYVKASRVSNKTGWSVAEAYSRPWMAFFLEHSPSIRRIFL